MATSASSAAAMRAVATTLRPGDSEAAGCAGDEPGLRHRILLRVSVPRRMAIQAPCDNVAYIARIMRSCSAMDRDLLPHLAIVLAVARRGGFAAAAAELGMGASAVSHAVRLVETRLGSPLFARTTRSVGLTEAGAALVEA